MAKIEAGLASAAIRVAELFFICGGASIVDDGKILLDHQVASLRFARHGSSEHQLHHGKHAGCVNSLLILCHSIAYRE
ncbi:MAG: hypothetical protein ACE3JK_14855 [Sporolactobacillus sp.]